MLDEGTVAALKSHRVRRASERLLPGAGKATAEDWIFADVEGHPYHPNAVSQRLNRKVKDAGIKHIGIHGLRHTGATLAIVAGVPAKVVSAAARALLVSITLDTYSHVLPAMDEHAVQQ
ncbi:MAG: tyrosine-type recombinase/integrase [Microthrixaceae bacterium]